MFEESDETIKKNKKTCENIFLSYWDSQEWLSFFENQQKIQYNYKNFKNQKGKK